MLEPPASEGVSALDAGAVHIHLVELDGLPEGLLARYPALLDPGECQRLDRFKVAGARLEFLVGRALLRTTLSRYRPAVRLEDWHFRVNAYGRPEIDTLGGEPLFFNLSHTRGLVALAVSGAQAIGVDVETLDRPAMTGDIARRYFTRSEAAFIEAGGDTADERFFALWTLKEAYIKARGMGLALPLDGFFYDLSGKAPRIDFVPDRIADDPAAWRFERRNISAHHRLALAIPATSATVRYFAATPLGEEPRPASPRHAPHFESATGPS